MRWRRLILLYLSPSSQSIKKWQQICVLINIVAMLFDPFVLFIPTLRNDKKCFTTESHKYLSRVFIPFRSVMDVFCFLDYIVEFCDNRQRSSASHPWVRPSWPRLFVHLLATLPVPQVVFSFILDMRGQEVWQSLLIALVFFQYLPRLYRIYQEQKVFTLIIDNGTAKALLNLSVFLIAAHVVGAMWYFFAIQRVITCWQMSCQRLTQKRCTVSSFRCGGDSSWDTTYMDAFCSLKEPKGSSFDFGIFRDAFRTDVVESSNVLNKFLFSHFWGLRHLSSAGRNLETSGYWGEIIFTNFITVSGLVVLAYFIGNTTMYLQATRSRIEQMRLNGHDIQQWSSFCSLSDPLRTHVVKYQERKWEETKGINIEGLLLDLPKELRRNIKRELCFRLLMRVPLFSTMDDRIVDIILDLLKPKLYVRDCCIVREGDTIEEMLFFTKGWLMMFPSETSQGYCDNLIGEELLAYAMDLNPSNLPTWTQSIRAHSTMQAFALKVEDLKYVLCQFHQLTGKQAQHTFRFYSQEWRMWATCFIQEALRQRRQNRCQANPDLPGSSSAVGIKKLFDVPENNVLVVSMEFQHDVTLDVLYKVFSAFGHVQKIAIFKIGGMMKALIQYSDVKTAVVAKEALEGHKGFCKLHISFSSLINLTIKSSEWSRDYTMPIPIWNQVEDLD